MARTTSKLTALGIARIDKAGRYGDGGGLYLLVISKGRKSWVYRFMLAGKARDMGLGSYPEIGLAEARIKAFECRRMRASGTDPIDARQKKITEARAAASEAITFAECASCYIEAHKVSWRNEKHAAQWSSTIKNYAEPVIGRQPIREVDVSAIMKVLQPIWQSKLVTANRLRGRIEKVLDWAKSKGYREGENPARWRGHLSNLLPAPQRFRDVVHHNALPYRHVADFMKDLRQENGIAARALELLILTATRTSETLGARWAEISMQESTWIIPADRIKARRQHRIPLSSAALRILEKMEHVRHDGFVFPSRRAGYPLSNMALLQLLHRMQKRDITAHGFRSTFRDWAAEETDFSRDTAEAALAHVVGDKVEAAYRRGDLFQKRRELMEAWAAHCNWPQYPAVILEFPAKAQAG